MMSYINDGEERRPCNRYAGRLLYIVLGVLVMSTGVIFGHGQDTDGDGMPDAWEQRYGLQYTNADAHIDSDLDGFDNYFEYIADTDPTNDASILEVAIRMTSNAATREIQFNTSSNRVYVIEYLDDLISGQWVAMGDKLSGSGAEITQDDTNIVSLRYYRLGVSFPQLFATPHSIFAGTVPVNSTSDVFDVYLTNEDVTNHLFMMTMLQGDDLASYRVTNRYMNYSMQSHETVQFGVMFAPTSAGVHEAQIKCHFDNHANHVYVDIVGVGEYIYHMNAGGSDYNAVDGTYWSTDSGYYNVGDPYSSSDAISSTVDDPLYQDERWNGTNTGSDMVYSFPVEPGAYLVKLHFAEIFPDNNFIGARVFDVNIEGLKVLDDFDIVAEAGYLTAHVEEFFVTVADDSLDIEFTHEVGNPKISAIEIRSGALVGDGDEHAWGHVALGETGAEKQLELTNAGDVPLTVTSLTFAISSGAAHDFTVTMGGVDYSGGDVDVMHATDFTIGTGQTVVIIITYNPTEEIDNNVSLIFQGNFSPLSLQLTGTGGDGTGHPFLHVVIRTYSLVVDYDGDNVEAVVLDGRESHTHEFGHVLTDYLWMTNDTVISTNVITTNDFALGTHTVSLEIYDDNVPPETLIESKDFQVVSATNVPGTLTLFYEGVAGSGEGSPSAMITAVPAHADYAQRMSAFSVAESSGFIDATPYTGTVMVIMHGFLMVTNMATFTFEMNGGVTNILLVDDVEYIAPAMLHVGRHKLEARFAIDHITNLPVAITYATGVDPMADIPEELISHTELDMLPVINTAPVEGIDLGGNEIAITGLGFFPTDEVIIHWGDIVLTGDAAQVTSEEISLITPASNGVITVYVETPNGDSDDFLYNYSSSGPVPITFNVTNAAMVITPSQAAWGPDGRLYVGSVMGTITVLSFDDNYNVTNTQEITSLQSNVNNNILGIGFNPFDSADNVRIYVAHGQLFANGGECFTGFSPYSGGISVLSGTNFETVESLITGLPVSNHDHGVNGIQFDNEGNLMVSIGGNSNAGVTNCNMGALPESPLSGAILKADVNRTNFNGHMVYVDSVSGATNTDQVAGNDVDIVDDVDVKVYAPGFRNAFDLVYTTKGYTFASDNGPNAGYGGASKSATTQDPDPEQNDTLNFVVEGNYYGHPNRNRGRYDARQYVYHDNSDVSQAGIFSQAMGEFQPSVNGLSEYRAQTFKGAMKDELLMQKWNGVTYRIALSDDGRSIDSAAQLPAALESLDVVSSPGGAILGIDYTDNAVKVAVPDDISAINATAFDIFPWRAPSRSNATFVIGGNGFYALSNTTVSFDGQVAALSYVSSSRIRGVIPDPVVLSSLFRDVEVISGAETSILTEAFRYLLNPGEGVGEWRTNMTMPHALGEVAGGVINGIFYLVGEGHPATMAYDIFSDTWLPDRAARSYVSGHHAVEVINDKLYLFGGFDGADTKVQIYDPTTDSWSLGADVPWAVGSASSALIDGKVYLAGGISGSSTVNSNAVYDSSSNTWTMLTSMPTGRNHAASSTDGIRFYIFGGRGPGSGDGNIVAEGFDDVMIYDPQTDTWESSFDGGSTIPPLPQKRGGMGKAVFFNGEFYVMGGETTPEGVGKVVGDVYDRVDVYNPVTKTWRLDEPMAAPRHGIFPVAWDQKIWVAGGSEAAGYGQSDVFDVFSR